jgi:TatD DNase family protein
LFCIFNLQPPFRSRQYQIYVRPAPISNEKVRRFPGITVPPARALRENGQVRLIDTHCHLASPPLADDLAGVMRRARERGVDTVIAPAYDLGSWARLAGLRGTPGALPAFGLHPWVAAEALEIDRLRSALVRHGAVAAGEIGLDFRIEGCDRGRQEEILRAQLGLALELDLPVLLHCRGAFEELATILGDLGGRVRGVLHAFSRGPELARRFLDLGLHLGFGGALTRPNARKARRSAEMAPLDRIVLETDAPSIGLEGVDPVDTEPHHVRDIAQALAEIRGLPADEIAAATTANAVRLFSIG